MALLSLENITTFIWVAAELQKWIFFVGEVWKKMFLRHNFTSFLSL